MNKILAVGIAVLGLFSTIIYFMYSRAEDKIDALKTQNNELVNKTEELENAIRNFNEAEERASKTIQKVRTVVRTIKDDNCDCYNTVLPDELLHAIRSKD